MPRASRHYMPGYGWHLTHRCHKKEFLPKLAGDRLRYLQWLFQAKKRYGLSVLKRLMAISAAQAVVQCRLSLGSRVNLSFGGKKISILQFLAWKKWYTLFDSA